MCIILPMAWKDKVTVTTNHDRYHRKEDEEESMKSNGNK